MSRSLSIALAQLNFCVGDIKGNTELILNVLQEQKNQADLVLFSELALSGYPPEDWLFRDDFYHSCETQLLRLQKASHEVSFLLGHPFREKDRLYNALSVFSEGKLLARYYKQCLPNHGVFDEARYFSSGKTTQILAFKGYRLGLLICEDLWHEGPVDSAKAAGAEILLSINASPYDQKKYQRRQNMLSQHCLRTDLPLIYLNQVGGQDELIFDGRSQVLNKTGETVLELPAFSEKTLLCEWTETRIKTKSLKVNPPEPFAEEYQALVMALRDYVQKNGFQGVLIGLSGGIDSALTLAIAVDALGKSKVRAYMMPSRYTPSDSVMYAQTQAKHLGVTFEILSIEPMFEAFLSSLKGLLKEDLKDITKENLQARCRGMLLMGLSNQLGDLVLTTSNKSETAVGYSTLYGDMAGGFNVLKDVPKTWVFSLAKYRNTLSEVIPKKVISRPPSAELKPNQLDTDSLPPYAILDAILEGYVERDRSVVSLIEEGFEEEVVRHVISLVDRNEYKRRQSPVGPRITARNFSKDRRYPITSGFSHNK
ncbi:NAD+ synthase [Candidatus Williamhamiltonella defendens]|nr:NAD+ synthase [Candidatus Hamiltonella defensa]AYB49164.1 NAD+ synthase [Candidatus Hamiltonella defensa]